MAYMIWEATCGNGVMIGIQLKRKIVSSVAARGAITVVIIYPPDALAMDQHRLITALAAFVV